MLMLKEEHHQVREMVRRFSEDVVAPRARELDETETFPHEAAEGFIRLASLEAEPVCPRGPGRAIEQDG